MLRILKLILLITLFNINNFCFAIEKNIERISIYKNASNCNTTEIVSVQHTSERLVLSCSDKGIVEVISIETPAKPKILNHFSVSEKNISSIAFHPTKNSIAVALINNDPFTAGIIQIHEATTGNLQNTFASGIHPDGLAFSPDGNFLVVANEGEAYRYNNGEYESPEGSITLIKFSNENNEQVKQIKLSDYSDVDGMLQVKHARTFERIVIGGNSNEEFEVPVKDNRPENTEPEFVTFTPDSTKAYVSLQENNGILIVNTATASIDKVFGLGVTEHLADTKDNGKVQFKNKITALREPDGIAITPDGKYLLTADEGATNPKASKTMGKKSKGGGRTLSIFDAKSGTFVSDTGNQLDEMAHAVGLYPDGRSDNKGSEPENVVSFEIDNILYAAVGLERANAIALVSLADPTKPDVLNVVGVDPKAGIEGQYAPEGLAYYEKDDRHYIFSANEKSGTMTVFEVR